MNLKAIIHHQRGMVVLLTALALLFSITLISLITSKTVLVETQITANNYRTSQAAEAASAAMDQGVAYFMSGGLDQHNNSTRVVGGDGLVDYIGPGSFGGYPAILINLINGVSTETAKSEPTATSCLMPTTTTFPISLTSGTQTTLSQVYFNNTDDNACDCQATVSEDIDGDGDGDCMGTLGTNMTRAFVIAKGWSDDCTATRTITQCVGTFDIFRSGQGPKQAFVSKAGVGVFGNAKIINRYNNSTIWSGGADAVHGASYGTYLRPSGMQVADYTTAQLDNENESENTQQVSNRDTGNGIDVVTDDPTLASKSTSRLETDMISSINNEFFDLFFAHTKAEIKNVANVAGQMFTSGTSLADKTGMIWVEGDAAIHNINMGSPGSPVIIIINGDLDLTGGNIYGVLYVTGELRITGNPVVKGSVISENGPNSGAGTLTLVYKPWGDDGTHQSPPFIIGTGTVIAGSWKDW
jgi:hypothetical protein